MQAITRDYEATGVSQYEQHSKIRAALRNHIDLIVKLQNQSGTKTTKEEVIAFINSDFFGGALAKETRWVYNGLFIKKTLSLNTYILISILPLYDQYHSQIIEPLYTLGNIQFNGFKPLPEDELKKLTGLKTQTTYFWKNLNNAYFKTSTDKLLKLDSIKDVKLNIRMINYSPHTFSLVFNILGHTNSHETNPTKHQPTISGGTNARRHITNTNQEKAKPSLLRTLLATISAAFYRLYIFSKNKILYLLGYTDRINTDQSSSPLKTAPKPARPAPNKSQSGMQTQQPTLRLQDSLKTAPTIRK